MGLEIMDPIQQKIIHRLKSLAELDNVDVKETHGGGSVTVEFGRYHALSFRFTWSVDHFIGYVLDGDDGLTQAVLSLYSPMDAVQFASAYSQLADLRAKQKAA
jgi:hypothetical protein